MLSLVGALGLLLVAVADTAARAGATAAELVFWIGLLLLFLPIVARLTSPRASRRERIGLVAILGVGLYVARVFQSPLSFAFIDEFQHWRTAIDIAQTGHLFYKNPILPVSPFYPGLEIVVTSLASISGLPVFDSAVIATGVARLLFVLALYLFFEGASGSPHVAGIAAVLYMCSPSFLFLDSAFVYESLGLPFAALALFALVLRGTPACPGRLRLGVVASLGIAATVVTHHVTSYALVAFLALWALAPLVVRLMTTVVQWPRWNTIARRESRGLDAILAWSSRYPTTSIDDSPLNQRVPLGMPLLALAMALAWLILVAPLTVDYLGPNLAASVTELMRLIAHDGNGRELFRSYTGRSTPLWEQVAMYTSVILVITGLPFGLVELWRKYRGSLVAVSLAGVALVYPVSMILRLTPTGINAAGRSLTFVYAGIAFVLAVAVAGYFSRRAVSMRKLPALAVLGSILFIGGTILNWAPESRMPGTYLVNSHTRSIGQEGMSAADWVRTSLGPGNRMAADFINQLIMGADGYQYPVGASAGWDVSQVFFSYDLGVDERALLRRARIRYVVVDRRVCSQLPIVGIYYETGEVDAFHHTAPMDPSALRKFDSLENVSRVFDSGNIVIYDVGNLLSAP